VRWFDWLRASTPTGSGAPPVKMMASKGVAVFGDPSRMVDSTRAVAHRRGDELHKEARVLTIVDPNLSQNGHYI
jgi:hypothetical protein